MGVDEVLWQTVKEATVDYVPKTRQERLVRVPTVRGVAGADLAVASEVQREIYSELEEALKKEQSSRRDQW
ncbi:MAG: hypothetical protein NWE98_03835 [Candidatus Bathyarchaeota archaeon]|nr:hypothetical protein [Candidatus Bathyarchaeota archaeon]